MTEVALDSSKRIAVMDADEKLTVEQINEAILEIWADTKIDQNAKQAALDAGLAEEVLGAAVPPYVVSRNEGQFGIAGTIAVFIGLEVAKKLIDKIVDTAWEAKVWKEYFLPQLRARFGARLRTRG